MATMPTCYFTQKARQRNAWLGVEQTAQPMACLPLQVRELNTRCPATNSLSGNKGHDNKVQPFGFQPNR